MEDTNRNETTQKTMNAKDEASAQGAPLVLDAAGESAEHTPGPISSGEVAREAGEIWGAAQTDDEDLERIARETDTPAKKFARWPEKKRLWFERVLGLVLGAGAGCALSLIPPSDSFLSMNVVVPLLMVLIVPRILENKLQTHLKIMKKFMLVALAAYIAVMAVLVLTGGHPLFA